MTDDQEASQPDERLEQVLAEYLHSVEAGQPLDRQQLLDQYPDLTDELRSFFRNHDAMEQLAEPVQEQAPTVGLDAAETEAAGNRVRYFGDYELVEEIARGGMGVIYKARQVNLKRIVALKLILAGQLAGPQEVQRFHAEAEAAAKLDHPGIVPIFEVGQHEGQHYFSMAFVDGESLTHRVAQGVMEPREAAMLMKKVAEAIAYAHVQGVVHRDLKPGNILMDKDGMPRVTDFGLAKRVEGESQELTATGQVLGTPSYMPPEQAAGDNAKIGPLADVYSLGAVLYCLVTGRPPFQTASPIETLLQVMTREPASPRQLNPPVPRDLETITLKCLEKDPARRYPSAQELADELHRFLDGRPIKARPLGAVGRTWRWCRRNRALAATIGLAACLILAVSGGYVANRKIKNLELATSVENEEHARVRDRLKQEQDWKREQEKIVEAFGRPGVEYDGNDLVSLDLSKPARLHGRGIETALRDLAIGDDALQHLKGLTRLQRLDLWGTRVTDVGLEHVTSLGNLKALDLTSTHVTDMGIVHLKDLTNLKELDLSGTKVTGPGLEHLKGLTNLRNLNLEATQVTDAGLEHLKGLTNLKSLSLNHNKINGAGLVHLEGMAGLTSLDLQATQVSDSGLEHVKGLNNLQNLYLSRTKVSDSGLVHLEGLEKLAWLIVTETQVTREGVRKLRQALPKCKICQQM